MKVRAIIFGATGMVGEGVLHECLLRPDVESILVLGRRACGVQHGKIREIVHRDFLDFSSIENELKGYNACFFCLGVSSVGKKEDEYRRVTYDLTLHAAQTLVKLNPGMTFCYISGMGTDSTEKGRLMWARVKGKTENDLMKLPFKGAYMFRPGFIKPIKGLKNTLAFAKILAPLYPVFKFLYSKGVVTLEHVGHSMINVTLTGYDKSILECEDIMRLGKRR